MKSASFEFQSFTFWSLLSIPILTRIYCFQNIYSFFSKWYFVNWFIISYVLYCLFCNDAAGQLEGSLVLATVLLIKLIPLNRVQEFSYCENNKAFQEQEASQWQRQAEEREVPSKHGGGGCWQGGSLQPALQKWWKEKLVLKIHRQLCRVYCMCKSLGVVKRNSKEKKDI